MSPSQVVLPFGETAHGAQAVPHALTLVASTQIPLQGFCPSGHFPSQAAPSSTHSLLQGFMPVGHRTPQRAPSQVLSPPVSVGQATQANPQ